MAQLNITINEEEIQKIIEEKVNDTFARDILTKTFNLLMEKQRDEYIQADNYERSNSRNSQRNGYYEREYTTRVGTLELLVPRTRDGKFSPDIIEKYSRTEKSILLTMLEMYISGVSTRKVSKVVETLCGKNFSKSLVSSLTKQLDPIVQAWKNRPLNKNYPYIITDVIYIKIREYHRVVSKSVHIAIGIDEEGHREIIGFNIDDGENEYSWKEFFKSLKDRGLKGVKMVTSDAHLGLIESVKKEFVGCSWQRCQVHFLRNIMNVTPKKESKDFRELVKALMKIKEIDAARIVKNIIIESYEENPKYEKACNTLDDGFEDAFTYLTAGNKYNRLKSTNVLERQNEEIRRREKVIRIFPNVASAERLIGALLMEIDENWISSSKKYIDIN